MKIINLTPHAIRLPNVTIESSGIVARRIEVTKYAHEVNGIKLITRTYMGTTDLPDKETGVMYIVSMLVRQAFPNRLDLFSPGDLVRDEEGNIIGCLNLVMNK